MLSNRRTRCKDSEPANSLFLGCNIQINAMLTLSLSAQVKDYLDHFSYCQQTSADLLGYSVLPVHISYI